MKYQFLPNQFKYVGLVLFIATGTLPYIQDFVNGFTAGYTESQQNPIDLGFPSIFYSKPFVLLKFLGILFYALAKDKVFDELMFKIRNESMYIVFFSTIIIVLIGLSINIDWKLSASDLIETQMFLFLIINAIRKRMIIT